MLLVDDFELFRQFVVELLGKDRNYRSIYVNIHTHYKIHYIAENSTEIKNRKPRQVNQKEW